MSSKSFLILNNGRVLHAAGFYEEDVAASIAQKEAKNNPGRTYTVVQVIDRFQFPKQAKSKS